MNKLAAGLSISTIFLFGAQEALADSLAEKNYFGLYIGTVDYDFDYNYNDFNNDNLDTGIQLEGYGNFNVQPQLDVIAGIAKGWADGSRNKVDFKLDVTEISGGARYFFQPNQKVNPYAGGGLQIVSWEYEVEWSTDKGSKDDTDLGIYLEGGVEVNFTQKLYTRFGGSIYTVDRFDGLELNGLVGYALSPGLYATLNLRLGMGDRQDTILFGMIKTL